MDIVIPSNLCYNYNREIKKIDETKFNTAIQAMSPKGDVAFLMQPSGVILVVILLSGQKFG
ncbi:MAG: hypothetical protein UGF45_09890 [Massilioclostridium sp.]|nr:hypothetical protein [Massilioclostridium sp.]MEE1492298.1 hypothetical protein [Massilioclostridium sp.]